MIGIVGDAELDEGNVYECLLESDKLGIRNAWWIVDYNRQSLDKALPEEHFRWATKYPPLAIKQHQHPRIYRDNHTTTTTTTAAVTSAAGSRSLTIVSRCRGIDRLFRSYGYNVITAKYGKQLKAAFKDGPAGKLLKKWVNQTDNNAYSALTFQGGAAFRKRMLKDIKDAEFKEYLAKYNDEELFELITNLGDERRFDAD